MDTMKLVIVGHVDHGKSTIIGRLLADTKSLPEGKLEQIQESCRRNSKPFEYAFLLDALKDVQTQGITIDTARVFFQSQKRKYIIMDAPGHIEFVKNMVTGAASAESALLVIDALEGVKENSRRHGYLLSMLGIKQISVLVNKMDLVNYSQGRFEQIVNDYSVFLEKIHMKAQSFIPVSGMKGDNIVFHSSSMKWYQEKTVLNQLDDFDSEMNLKKKSFRMPVQGVYKFTKDGDSRRIIAGTIESGSVKVGEEAVFYPSGKKSKIHSIEKFNSPQITESNTGEAAGFTLKEQIYAKRGDLMVLSHENPKPKVTTFIKANLFWLGKIPFEMKKEYWLKIHTSKIKCRLQQINKVLDADKMEIKENVKNIKALDVAEVQLKLDAPISFDLADENTATSRFVIVDEYKISGGGIIIEALNDKQEWQREKVFLRNLKWERGEITDIERARRNHQKSFLVVITGQKNSGKKPLAKNLEKELFKQGNLAYFLGIRNILYGIDADIKGQKKESTQEHIRRFSETAFLLLDLGAIAIITATELTKDDMEIFVNAVTKEKILTVWLGEKVTTDIDCDIHFPETANKKELSEEIKNRLMDIGVIFKPW